MTTELTDQAALVAKPARAPRSHATVPETTGSVAVIGAGPGGLAARDSRVISCGRTQYNNELELATR